MPVKKTDSGKVNFVQYIRASNKDFNELKLILTNLAQGPAEVEQKDVVVDLFGSPFMYSNEIGFLISIAKRLQAYGRLLVVLASPKLIQALENTNIHKVDNIRIQNNQWDIKYGPADEETPPPAEVSDRRIELRCPMCDYRVWIDQPSLDIGLPFCPFNHAMRRSEEGTQGSR
jgi:anti-anti-sigma regulatory factor